LVESIKWQTTASMIGGVITGVQVTLNISDVILTFYTKLNEREKWI